MTESETNYLRLCKEGGGEAHGALEVCAFTAIKFFNSKLAFGLVILAMLEFGIVQKYDKSRCTIDFHSSNQFQQTIKFRKSQLGLVTWNYNT